MELGLPRGLESKDVKRLLGVGGNGALVGLGEGEAVGERVGDPVGG